MNRVSANNRDVTFRYRYGGSRYENGGIASGSRRQDREMAYIDRVAIEFAKTFDREGDVLKNAKRRMSLGDASDGV